MQSISEWLQALGLERYTKVFDENGFDLEAMALVTDSDLEKLGVLLGHRRKLIKAAAELNGTASPALAPEAEASRVTPAPAASDGTAAERRQLTVMFCDLVGSTQMSERLDPEDLREVIRAYQESAAQVIERFGGHIAQYLGDGLLVYFGHPLAHEDDAQRAVRAGLGIVAAMTDLSARLMKKTQVRLSVRIGIHTGVVVVGEVGGGARHEQLALGDTPNLAARLQSLAEVGSVVLSEHTRQLAGQSFECRDLGSHVLKGVAEAVHVWQATGERRAESRFDAAHRGAPAPMVGRDIELATALRAWDQVRVGNGQVVLVCGEPGIGKSRLLEALRETTAPDGAHVWQYQCSPYFVNTALYPVIDNFERALRSERDEAPGSRLDRLARLMREYERPESDLNLVARLLSLPAEERYGALGMSSQKQKEETLRALNDITAAAARTRPVLMLFEDLHWADPTTLGMLEELLARIEKIPVLLLATHRPEFRPGWDGQPLVTALTLGRLDARQTTAVAGRVAAEKRLPEEIVKQIVSKTDGVPLFVEELTKAILESGLLVDRGDSYTLSGPLPALSIPSTLRDSLMSRLDRLAAVKEIAQIGACIGREFGHELLSLVSPLKDARLEQALDQLVASELVFGLGSASDSRFMFKHALVRDTAYDSLLKTRRVQIHALIAQALEDHFPETARSEPELLARHLSSADLPERAIPYWLAAGRQATARSANAEAIGHLSKGVELVLTQPASQQRDRIELDLRVSLTTPIIATHGWGGPEFAEAYRQAVDLCDRVDDPDLLSRALYMQWGYGTWTARHRIAEQAATRMLAMAEARGQRVARLMGHGLLGRVQCYIGDIQEGRRNIELSLALADPVQDAVLAMKYGQDPIMAGLAGLSWCLWALGYPGHARQARDQAIERAELVKHPQTLAYALAVGLWVGLLELDAEHLEPLLLRLNRLIDEQSFKHWNGFALNAQAFVLSERGDKRAAREAAREGRAALEAAGCAIFSPLFASFRARMLLEQGAIAEAQCEVEEALATARRTEEGFALAEIQRLRGEIFLARGEEHSAAECFDAALATARAQGARMLELRAATAYARLLVTHERQEQARQLLEPVCSSFSEELPTRDITDARVLVVQIR